MHLSRNELREIDEPLIRSLCHEDVTELCLLILEDLKETQERLNQNSQNSSLSPSSDYPWVQFDPDGESKDEPDED